MSEKKEQRHLSRKNWDGDRIELGKSVRDEKVTQKD